MNNNNSRKGKTVTVMPTEQFTLQQPPLNLMSQELRQERAELAKIKEPLRHIGDTHNVTAQITAN